MNLIKIELGDGRSVKIRKETTVGQMENVSFLESSWVESAKERRKSTKRMSSAIIACVYSVSGFQDDDTYNNAARDLDADIELDSDSLNARYLWIRKHLTLPSIQTITDELVKASKPSEKLEGN